MRTIILNLILSLVFVVGGYAQTQQGIVKTKGRLGTNGSVIAGSPLQGAMVMVKGRTNIVSGTNGKFSFPVSGQNYYVQNARKQGYVLTDPDILSKQYSYSKENPLYIVMETPDTQTADKLAAERKIRRTLQKTLQQREDEIEQLKEENKISQQEYQQKLQELYSSQEKNEKLISEMAECYSQMDYDQVDEFNRRVSELILNGELAKADSLLNTKGDIHARVTALKHHQGVNAKEEEELFRRQENLSKSKAYTQKELEDLAQDCYHKYEIFKMDYQNDSAAYYLELRAELDTTNVDWQLEVGDFISDFISDYDKAMNYNTRALSISQSLYDEESGYVASCYYYIGSMYEAQSNYDKALEYNLKALSIRKNLWGENNIDVALSYNNTGLAYYNIGNFDKAMEYHQLALDIRQLVLAENNPDIATSYSNIGSVYFNQGNYDKALDYSLMSLKIWQNAYGKYHQDVALAYNNIGIIYDIKGEYGKSVKYNLEALNILQTVYGEKHPKVANSYNSVGVSYYRQGDFVKTLEQFNKALDIQKCILGENHRDIAMSYNNIGVIYSTQGNHAKALEYFLKALKIHKTIYGDNHPSVAVCYSNVGGEYRVIEEYEQAMECFMNALKIQKSVVGENHPGVAQSYKQIGLLHYTKGDDEGALDYYNRALKVLEASLGENHPEAVSTYVSIGNIYFKSEEKGIKLSGFDDFIANTMFNVTLNADRAVASTDGKAKEFVVLEYDDWTVDTEGNLLAKNKEIQDKPKTVVLLKDGVISIHNLNDQDSVRISLQKVEKDDKQHIIDFYHKWKKGNNR